MKNKINTIAIILASGLGHRFDKNKLKQYQIINGEAVICHSVNIFNKNPKIDKVIVVINKNHEKQANKYLTDVNSISIIHGFISLHIMRDIHIFGHTYTCIFAYCTKLQFRKDISGMLKGKIGINSKFNFLQHVKII